MDVNIRGDDKIVIVVDEVMARRWPVKGNRHQHQQYGQEPHRNTRPNRLRGRCSRRCGLGFDRWFTHGTPKKLLLTLKRPGNFACPFVAGTTARWQGWSQASRLGRAVGGVEYHVCHVCHGRQNWIFSPVKNRDISLFSVVAGRFHELRNLHTGVSFKRILVNRGLRG